MSKQAYREAQRIAPCGPAGIKQMEAIVAQCQMMKVNEVAIDLYSASVVLAVWKRIGEKNQAKLVSLPVVKVVEICLQVAK